MNKKRFSTLLIMMLFSLCFLTVPRDVKANDTNLASIPSFWSYPNNAGWGLNNPLDSQTSYYAYPVTKGGQSSIKMLYNPYYITTYGFPCISELDGEWINVSPGNVVIFKAWLWVDTATISEPSYAGGVIGIDMYSNRRIEQVSDMYGVGVPVRQNGVYNYYMDRVPFGGTNWQQLTMTFIVQNTYEADGFGGYAAGSIVTPTAFIPWIAILTSDTAHETAGMYVYRTELYINPSSSPIPSPSPSPTPSPTPSGSPGPTPTPSPTPPFPIHSVQSPTPTSSPSSGTDLSGIAGMMGAVMVIGMAGAMLGESKKRRRN